ncbi:MAG: phytanoyl-CoA dioxygenase family protein [Planctomycetes bacterium]|nr:phytanoyl-CoA dioxygenase family protein [Planctomycetota bacterium]
MTATTTPKNVADLRAELDRYYPLTPDQIRRFREDGFIKLKGIFSRPALDYYGGEVTRVTMEINPQRGVPLEKRSTYDKAFIQVGNIWEKNAVVREFSFSKRLARIAAELMGTTGVRMWHDQALYKEAGGGFTPWHADQQYWPMASGLSVTAWVPLQAVPAEMGPMCFGRGSHLKNIGRDLEISDTSEKLIRDAVREQGIIESAEPYEEGEVSFHTGWTLHRAGPNTTDRIRRVHTVIYMDEDMRVAQPKNTNQESDRKEFCGDTKVGEIMTGPKTPVLYSTRS